MIPYGSSAKKCERKTCLINDEKLCDGHRDFFFSYERVFSSVCYEYMAHGAVVEDERDCVLLHSTYYLFNILPCPNHRLRCDDEKKKLLSRGHILVSLRS
jgi:hypothetical protein